jgi:hypothetical protein
VVVIVGNAPIWYMARNGNDFLGLANRWRLLPAG